MKPTPALALQQTAKNLPSKDNIKNYLEKVSAAKEQLASELGQNKIPPLNIAYQNDDLAAIEALAQQICQKFSAVVILGVGGSSLGGKAITAVASKPLIPLTFLESIDPDTVKKNLRQIDLSKTLFLVISKSGETIETLCQTLIILDEFHKNKLTDFGKNFIFITQKEHNSLYKIAESLGSQIYFHPNNIGGRFSYLTIVGLLPAALAGLDISSIREGARSTLENFLNTDLEQNSIAEICAIQLQLFDQGQTANVVMAYADRLKDFTDWYRQLWAESLGKDGFGSTPINSMGTIDQHSQLQLYLDGVRDKFFTFITSKNHCQDFIIKDLPDCPTMFSGKNLAEILLIEQNSTIDVLASKNLPVRAIELNEINEKNLSALMMQMFLETIIIAKVRDINPFDQPAVELRKQIARQYLLK